MQVQFFSSNPRQKARPELDEVLSHGVDQLVVACAYCTAAGVAVLKRHADKFKRPDSFAVLSATPPTDYEELAHLHNLIPGHLFMHWGTIYPYEKENGAALMHSKVFYARSGKECWLWTGSHNLTANATQGANCEAAVLLHGDASEQPFIDALAHLMACRDEAKPYDPSLLPMGSVEQADVLVIHAEIEPSIEGEIKSQSGNVSWYIHLCLATPEYDDWLRPPLPVQLFLYDENGLLRGWQYANPVAAYSGALTGLNLTENNPSARREGTPAQWRAANYSITETRGVLALGPDGPLSPQATTQAVIHIDERAKLGESHFSREPKLGIENEKGPARVLEVDPDVAEFYTRNSIRGHYLVLQPITGKHRVIRVPDDETRERDMEKIISRLTPSNESFNRAELKIIRIPLDPRQKRHPFIQLARYRFRNEL